MRKILYLSLILCMACAVMSCGSGSSGSNPVIPPQQQTSSFAFMREAGGLLFTPMIGKFVTTGTTTTLTIGAVVDPTTNQPVTGEFFSITLSPDGKTAAVDLYGGQNGDSGQWDIFIASSGGSGNLKAVTNDAYPDAMPQFSPDGTRVIFNSERAGPQSEAEWQIVTRKVDGTGEVVLPMPLGAVHTWAPTYSPDSSKIAVEAWGVDSLGNPFDGIVTMKTDGSNARLLTNPLTTCTCYDENPAFTADGTKITFSRDRWDSTTSSETEDMYIMNADGSGVTRLTSGAGINFDPMAVNVAGMGLLILFSSNRDNLSATGSSGFELYSMKLDGSGIMRVTNNTLYDAFSGEWYERGSSTAQRTAQPRASHHRLPFGYNTGQKVRW